MRLSAPDRPFEPQPGGRYLLPTVRLPRAKELPGGSGGHRRRRSASHRHRGNRRTARAPRPPAPLRDGGVRRAAPALTAPQTDAAPPTPHSRNPPRSPGTSSPASPAAPGRSPRPPAASSRRPWPPVSSLPGLGWAHVAPREPSAGRRGGVEVVPPARARSSGAAPLSRRLYNRDGNMGRARRGGGCHGDAGRARLGCGNAARPGGV